MKKLTNSSGNTKLQPGNSTNFSLLENKLRKMVREELLRESRSVDFPYDVSVYENAGIVYFTRDNHMVFIQKQNLPKLIEFLQTIQ
jgi:hypothetical protein